MGRRRKADATDLQPLAADGRARPSPALETHASRHGAGAVSQAAGDPAGQVGRRQLCACHTDRRAWTGNGRVRVGLVFRWPTGADWHGCRGGREVGCRLTPFGLAGCRRGDAAGPVVGGTGGGSLDRREKGRREGLTAGSGIGGPGGRQIEGPDQAAGGMGDDLLDSGPSPRRGGRRHTGRHVRSRGRVSVRQRDASGPPGCLQHAGRQRSFGGDGALGHGPSVNGLWRNGSSPAMGRCSRGTAMRGGAGARCRSGGGSERRSAGDGSDQRTVRPGGRSPVAAVPQEGPAGADRGQALGWARHRTPRGALGTRDHLARDGAVRCHRQRRDCTCLRKEKGGRQSGGGQCLSPRREQGRWHSGTGHGVCHGEGRPVVAPGTRGWYAPSARPTGRGRSTGHPRQTRRQRRLGGDASSGTPWSRAIGGRRTGPGARRRAAGDRSDQRPGRVGRRCPLQQTGRRVSPSDAGRHRAQMCGRVDRHPGRERPSGAGHPG